MAHALAEHGIATSDTAHARQTPSRKQRHNELQAELFDLRAYNAKLMLCLANLICGEEKEQREAIDSMIELIKTDIRLAKRMVLILEQNPHLMGQAHELYECAMRSCMPSSWYV